MTSLCAKLRHVTGWPSAKVHYQGQKRLAFTGQHKSQLNSTSHKLEKKISTIAFSLFIFNKFIYFIFWLHWVFVAVHGLSLVVASGGCSSCGARASHCSGFSCCGAQALGARASVVVARGLQ